MKGEIAVICIGPTLGEEKIAELRAFYEYTPELDEQAELHAAFANPLRLKILAILQQSGAVCVCDLRDIIGVTTSAISQHLAKLKAYRLVSSRRDGQTVFYSVTEHPFLSWIEWDQLSRTA
jgi:DNA-binding transcriptional ArsR family regulator